ncbi:hypothetical protein CEY16_03470 [Halalkalibacillus sediminis]|uniref:Uncharacterized protein n=1 Tax=Halalkalibacillus sediminis TaxID=2018042 RepID=A0A2I0QWZ2_9BACI|nr:hypothetical protein [Halalkalibacillus sediminis]PKR78825.1 hypothetical protein CEY16_03470 [Halalkalibacillus sediminis]
MRKLSSALLVVMTLFIGWPVEADEIVFSPAFDDDWAVLQFENGLFAIPLDKQMNVDSLKKVMSKEKQPVIGLLALNLKEKDCETLEELNFEIQTIYSTNSSNSEVCSKNSSFDLVNEPENITLENGYTIKIINDGGNKNFAITNGSFKSFWYFSPIKSLELPQKVHLLYLGSHSIGSHFTEDIQQLDPEVAIIDQQKNNREVDELLHQEWVDSYYLQKNLSIHVEIRDERYDLFLERQDNS